MESSSNLQQLTDLALQAGYAFVASREILNEQGVNIAEDPRFDQLMQVLNGTDKSARLASQYAQLMQSFDSQNIRQSFAPAINHQSTELRSASVDELQENMLLDLREALQNGVAEEIFPIGTVFADTYTDTATGKSYNMPLRVVHYQNIPTPNGNRHNRAYLLRTVASLHRVYFSENSKCRYHASQLCNFLNDPKGYAEGCSKTLLQVVTPVRLSTNAGIIETTFFAPSLRELHTGFYGKSDQTEEMAWKYFRQASLKLNESDWWRLCRDVDGDPVSYWTRHDSEEEFGNWYIDDDGCPCHCRACDNHTIVVACSITA